MNDPDLNKYLLGELTMGDYYVLAKLPPIAAVQIKEGWGASYANCHNIAMTADDVVFRLEGTRQGDTLLIPRSAKVKVNENKVTTKDGDGRDVLISFYQLIPTPNPLKKK